MHDIEMFIRDQIKEHQYQMEFYSDVHSVPTLNFFEWKQLQELEAEIGGLKSELQGYAFLDDSDEEPAPEGE